MRPAGPKSQDHQVFARHNTFGTCPVPKPVLNTTKKRTADAAAAVTKQKAKIAVKKAAKQAAAETAEAKQKAKKKKKKDKATEEEATKDAKQAMSAEDAAPAKATKEDEAVRLARGLTSGSAPSPGSATAGPCTAAGST